MEVMRNAFRHFNRLTVPSFTAAVKHRPFHVPLPAPVKNLFIFYLMFLKLDLIVRPFFLPILIP